jgi:hypothetical protein
MRLPRGLLSSIAVMVMGVLFFAPVAAGGATTPISLNGFSDMVVDDANDRVYVSGGSGSSSVVVLDFNGGVVTTIATQPGAAGMALDAAASTLYVALSDSNGISKIDTTTLAEVARLSISPASGAQHLALAGGRLWFSHDCSSGSSRFASIATDGTDLQEYSGAGYPSVCSLLATNPADSNILVASDVGSSPPNVRVYDASTNVPTSLLAASASSSDDFEDMVVTPDGSKLLAAAGYPYSLQAFQLSDLAGAGSYPTGAYPTSVAITTNGAFIAAGVESASAKEILVFPATSSTPVRSFDFGSTGTDLFEGALAFSPDAKKLFAVARGTTVGTVNFRVFDSPTAVLRATSTSLAVSATKLKYNQTVKLTAHLTGTKTGTMSIYATPYGGTKTLVRSGSVNSYGNLTASYTMKQKTTFKAEYSGSDTHAASKSSGKTVAVYAIATVRMINYYGTSGKYRLYRKGTYPDAVGAVKPNHAGYNLKFVAQQYYAGAWRAVASDTFPLGWDSTFYAYLITTSRGTYRMRTVFAGDADHLGDSSPWAYFQIR